MGQSIQEAPPKLRHHNAININYCRLLLRRGNKRSNGGCSGGRVKKGDETGGKTGRGDESLLIPR